MAIACLLQIYKNMAWLMTNTQKNHRRRMCVVVFLGITMMAIFKTYTRRSNTESLGDKQLVLDGESFLSLRHLNWSRTGDHGLAADDQSLKTIQGKNVLTNNSKNIRDNTASKVTNGVSDKSKEIMNHTSFDSVDEVSDMLPIYDYRKYPCLAGLPAFSTNKSSTEGYCVRTINFTAEDIRNTENCTNLKTSGKRSTPICTHAPDKDVPVSSTIHKTGRWERGLMEPLERILMSQKDLELLDIGCNIGVYTLTIAHQGTKVTAIDPLIENIKLLSQSVILGNLRTRVTLIWNALSDQHKEVTFVRFKGRVGRTQITDPIPNVDSDLARTIMLDDLIPAFKGKRVVLKMDIEESEYIALLGGARFFSEVDVPLIQMEIEHNKATTGPMIIDYLESYKFRPFQDIKGKISLNPYNLLSWPANVYFIKNVTQKVESRFLSENQY